MKIGPTAIAVGIMVAVPVIVANVSLPVSTAKSASNQTRSPVEIRQYPDVYEVGQMVLRVTSVENIVLVKSITVNRGNCAVWSRYPDSGGRSSIDWSDGLVVRYGDALKLATSCSDILEVKIETDLGEFEFKTR